MPKRALAGILRAAWRVQDALADSSATARYRPHSASGRCGRRRSTRRRISLQWITTVSARCSLAWACGGRLRSVLLIYELALRVCFDRRYIGHSEIK